MYVSSDVRLGLVLGRHPEINLFGLHYCVICYKVETKCDLNFVFRLRRSILRASV